VGVDQGGVEALLPHVGLGAMGGALALAADAVEIDVVGRDVLDVHGYRLVGEGGETDLAAAVDHVHRVVDRA